MAEYQTVGHISYFSQRSNLEDAMVTIMETFSALLAFFSGNSPVIGEFPAHRPVTPSFDVFFDLPLNQQLSKQWRRRWFETPTHSLWRHCNVRHRWVLASSRKFTNAITYLYNSKLCNHDSGRSYLTSRSLIVTSPNRDLQLSYHSNNL